MLDYKLRVVTVTNNIENYPQFAEDTGEFPELVKYVNDEADTFIIDDLNHDNFWYERDFFNMVSIKSMLVDKKELVS